MDNNFEDKFKKLKETILKLRNKGEVVMEYASFDLKDEVKEIIFSFLKNIGRRPSHGEGYDWIKLDLNQVKQILSEPLFKDMAYGHEFMSKSLADELAGKFIELFDAEHSQYFSNGYPAQYSPDGSSYYSSTSFGITQNTFDSGVIILDKNHIGILWFGDED